MSSVEVGGMEWREMVALVQKRFNKLAMCKRGSIATDINNQMEKLGKCPSYTTEERKEITKSLAKARQKALTPTLAMVKKYDNDIRGLQNVMYGKLQKVEENIYVHPGRKAWNQQVEMIQSQKEAREAALDGDFQDVVDSFMLKLWDLDELPVKYVELEKSEW